MNPKSLDFLEDIKNGKSYTLTKCSDSEIFELVDFLKNLDIIKKNDGSYSIRGFEMKEKIEKLIEFEDISIFNDWLSSESLKPKIKFEFNNSNVGQINNSSNVSGNAVINFNTKSEPQKDTFLIKLWKLISENKLISTLVAGIIFYLISEFFGIKIK